MAWSFWRRAVSREVVVFRHLPGELGQIPARGQRQAQEAGFGQLPHIQVASAAGVQRAGSMDRVSRQAPGFGPALLFPLTT